jgi:hypothetical protein
MMMECPVSVGELLDKLTILEIKLQHITDDAKRHNVQTEYDVLSRAKAAKIPMTETLKKLYSDLKEVNQTLWTIEDDIRDCERNQDFGPRFITLARAVYVTNDKRAMLKHSLNRESGSQLIEEKSYAAY